MGITPLDLSTIFVQMNQVTKVQSQAQQAAALQQNQEAKKLVEQELLKDNSVQPSSDDSPSTRIKDQKNPKQSQQQGSSSLPEEEKEKENLKKEIVQDPDMGSHVDLSG